MKCFSIGTRMYSDPHILLASAAIRIIDKHDVILVYRIPAILSQVEQINFLVGSLIINENLENHLTSFCVLWYNVAKMEPELVIKPRINGE
ncbi:hypothetical protein HanRHA438_Chr09g0412211 [Helianthus annuus]|nr:hypothetical protein HanRHA438_Chr09g0412211 [Helianthus annuus]